MNQGMLPFSSPNTPKHIVRTITCERAVNRQNGPAVRNNEVVPWSPVLSVVAFCVLRNFLPPLPRGAR